MRKQGLPACRKRYARRCTHDELHAHGFFQLLDILRNGGRRRIEHARGASDTACIGNGDQDAQLVDFHCVVQRFVRHAVKRLTLLYAFTNVTRSQEAYAGISWRHGYGVAVPVLPS